MQSLALSQTTKRSHMGETPIVSIQFWFGLAHHMLSHIGRKGLSYIGGTC